MVEFGGPWSQAGAASLADPFKETGFGQLIANMNGGNGSTTWTDSGKDGHVMTAVNGCAQTTAEVQFGLSSGQFTSSSTQSVNVAGSADFLIGTRSFLIDVWIRQTSASGTRAIFGLGDAANDIALYTSAGNLVAESRGSTFVQILSSGPTLNTWTHLRFQRRFGRISLYKNGVQIGPILDDDNDLTLGGATPSPDIGTFGWSSAPWEGQMDGLLFEVGTYYEWKSMAGVGDAGFYGAVRPTELTSITVPTEEWS